MPGNTICLSYSPRNFITTEGAVVELQNVINFFFSSYTLWPSVGPDGFRYSLTGRRGPRLQLKSHLRFARLRDFGFFHYVHTYPSIYSDTHIVFIIFFSSSIPRRKLSTFGEIIINFKFRADLRSHYSSFTEMCFPPPASSFLSVSKKKKHLCRRYLAQDSDFSWAVFFFSFLSRFPTVFLI